MDISVIVPLYHGRKYFISIINMLQKALQNFKAEIIFVNDYPEERFDDLFERCCASVSIRLLQNDRNYGIHESRVRGLKAAKGEYILFLDQDDKIDVSYFEKQMEKIKGYDACLCNGVYRNNKLIYGTRDIQNKAIQLDDYVEQKTVIISPGQVLIKRDAIPETWTKKILTYNGSDDVLLWIMMMSNKCSFNICEELLYEHKEEGDNTSLDFQKMWYSVTELKQYLLENQILDEVRRRNLILGLDRRLEKYICYISLLNAWSEIIKAVYCKLIDHKGEIAVYGYGIIGKKLIGDLEKKGLPIRYAIDKDANIYNEKILEIVQLHKIPSGIRYVVNTVCFGESVKKQIKDINKNIVTYDLTEFMN